MVQNVTRLSKEEADARDDAWIIEQDSYDMKLARTDTRRSGLEDIASEFDSHE